ncbi:twin-arginine translocase TatA/TatE family subunit [Streptomyces sp. NBC_01171]|uniref:twin-arginine translocase TatA/TatE family subunit n=1 Tax=Streptomyces sp. NBC_01171 TaxID=2903757 RepID=UPI00386A785A|nr:twin-arginine translocase TatA/TatE family subunit [Streptomyces sp. NBC_01171]
MFGLSEVALLLIVLIALLGVRKLPGLVRSAGQATRIFKSEARAMRTQDAPPASGTVIEGTVLPRDERS